MNGFVHNRPGLDRGIPKPEIAGLAGGTLVYGYADDAVSVRVDAHAAHELVCGRTKCCKHEGALFPQIAVFARDQDHVPARGDELKVCSLRHDLAPRLRELWRAHVRSN